MLKNQDAVPEPPISVAQARVTPDELAKALAAIEARRQAEAAHLAGTIPIEQAVSDLHLDSTSDEIWAEVQAQRTKAATVREQPPRLKPREAVQPVGTERVTRRRGWRRLVAPVLVIGVLMSTGVIPHNFGPHGFSPSLITPKNIPTTAPKLEPLSAVPDGVDVFADAAALTQISEGKPAAQISVSENASGNRWTVSRRGGHIYLRGFTEHAADLAELTGKPLTVYNDDNSGELEGDRTSSVTLRVDSVPLQKSGGGEDYSGITVLNFQPDSFTTLTPGR